MRTFDDYYPLFSRLSKLLARRVELHSEPPLREILGSYPRLVWALSHGTPISWMPLVFIIGREITRCGGGKRRVLGVFHRTLHRVPLLGHAIRFLGQSDATWGADQIANALSSGQYSDLAVLPEGHNAFIGRCTSIRPFVSSRFVEIAIRSSAPILIVAHVGTESWCKHARAPYSLPLLRRISPRFHANAAQAECFCIPTLPWRMPVFKLACQLYEPTLKVSDLSEDRNSRHVQIHEEAQRVREIMVTLLDQLGDPRSTRLSDSVHQANVA